MALENNSNKESSTGRSRRFATVHVQLASKLASDFNKGIEQIKKWLEESSEDQEIYTFLEQEAKNSPALQETIEELLEEMIYKGSKLALQTLSTITSDLITEADDSYYAGELNKAVKLYSQVLQNNPDDKRARRQLEKIWSKDSSENLPTQIPREAVQYYRMARSYMAAGDNKSAITFLGAAVDEAEKVEAQFIEAATLLGRLQELENSAEYKAQAEKYLREDRWLDALDSYNKAARLEPSETSLSNLIAGLTELVRVNEAIESLQQNPASLESKINEWRKTKEIENLLEHVAKTALVTTALYRRVMQVYVNGLSAQLSELMATVNSNAAIENSDLVKRLRELMYKVLTDLPTEGQSDAYKKLRGLFNKSGNFVASENLAELVVQEINASLESTRRAHVRATFPWRFTSISLVILVVGLMATVLRVIISFPDASSGIYFYLILGGLALIGSWIRSTQELILLESINGNKSFELLMLKPLIGSGLALIVLLAIRSGLLVVDVELSAFLYWAVSILVGYTQPAVNFILGLVNKNWITSIKG